MTVGPSSAPPLLRSSAPSNLNSAKSQGLPVGETATATYRLASFVNRKRSLTLFLKHQPSSHRVLTHSPQLGTSPHPVILSPDIQFQLDTPPLCLILSTSFRDCSTTVLKRRNTSFKISEHTIRAIDISHQSWRRVLPTSTKGPLQIIILILYSLFFVATDGDGIRQAIVQSSSMRTILERYGGIITPAPFCFQNELIANYYLP